MILYPLFQFQQNALKAWRLEQCKFSIYGEQNDKLRRQSQEHLTCSCRALESSRVKREPFFSAVFCSGLWGSRRRLNSPCLLGSMTTSNKRRESSKPSGLNYLLTQIIKFQGPHGSGATKPSGRLGPDLALAGGSPSLNHILVQPTSFWTGL